MSDDSLDARVARWRRAQLAAARDRYQRALLGTDAQERLDAGGELFRLGGQRALREARRTLPTRIEASA